MSSWKSYKEKNKLLTAKDVAEEHLNNFIDNESIFVAIPALNEIDLVTTIKSCFEQAKNPEKVYIGLCNQKTNNEPFEDFKEYKNLKKIDIRSEERIGLGCAFLMATLLYDKQDYFMRVDRKYYISPKLGFYIKKEFK